MREMQNRIHDDVVDLIQREIELFADFERVFIFGSAVRSCEKCNDIDILLVYKRWSNEIALRVEQIVSTLEPLLSMPVDVTALSENEVAEVSFLEKVKPTCARVK